jgi:AcrR family transcriptional regulator
MTVPSTVPERRTPMPADDSTAPTGTAPRPVHRDPERTRAAILAAATREFAEKGFGGARVDSIAARAGTNKRMLYHYFGDKEALYLVVLEDAYAGIRGAEATLDLGHRDPEDGLRDLALFTWRYFVEHPEFISLLNTENLMRARFLKGSRRIREMQTHLVGELTSVLRRGEAKGIFVPGLDPLHVYLSIASMAVFYLSNQYTLSVIFGRELGEEEELAAWEAHVVRTVLASVRK